MNLPQISVLNLGNLSSAIDVVKNQANPTIDLLICYARTHIDSAIEERIQALIQEQIDWRILLAQAEWHGVLPLVYHSMQKIGLDQIPQDTRLLFQSKYQSSILRNLNIVKNLFDVLDLLHGHGVSAIPFKGPVLSALVYGDTTLREFCDLDLLVSEANYLKARDILISHGYQPVYQAGKPPWFLTQTEEIKFIQKRGECSLIYSESYAYLPSSKGRFIAGYETNLAFSIDLHSKLISGDLFELGSDFNAFSQQLELISVSNRYVHSLNLENLLIYLCIHGTKSCWSKLKWICDIAELISNNQEIDLERVIMRSQNLGAKRMLIVGLSLAYQVLGADLPVSVLKSIQEDLIAQRLTVQVLQKTYKAQDFCNNQPNFEKFLFHFKAMEKQRDRLRYFAKWGIRSTFVPFYNLFKPTYKDRAFLSLPRSLYVLYYLIRPLRISKQLWTKAFEQSSSSTPE